MSWATAVPPGGRFAAGPGSPKTLPRVAAIASQAPAPLARLGPQGRKWFNGTATASEPRGPPA